MIWRALAVGFAFCTHEAELEAERARATGAMGYVIARSACAVDVAAAERCNDQLIECDAWRDGVQFSLSTILHVLRGDL